MKVDGGIALDLHQSVQAAKDAEAAGYSGAWTAETNHDPFFPLLLAAEHTTKMELGTSIAVAFARNPMTLANIGWDLQSYSRGRFEPFGTPGKTEPSWNSVATFTRTPS